MLSTPFIAAPVHRGVAGRVQADGTVQAATGATCWPSEGAEPAVYSNSAYLPSEGAEQALRLYAPAEGAEL